MKPILAIDKEGYVTSVERIRGKDKVIPRIIDIVTERVGQGEKSVFAFPTPMRSRKQTNSSKRHRNALLLKEFLRLKLGRSLVPILGPGHWLCSPFPAK